MNKGISDAVDKINELNNGDNGLPERFYTGSATYAFLQDCFYDGSLQKEYVDEYPDDAVENWLHNILVYGFDVSYEKADEILNSKNESVKHSQHFEI